MTRQHGSERGICAENWPVCWGCGKSAPKQSNNCEHGWVGRYIRMTGLGKCREIYCAACFRDWGWPEVKQ